MGCYRLIVSSIFGCTSSTTRTFAGFTFGGGGKTFDAEPAILSHQDGVVTLEAGTADSPVYLKLQWLGELDSSQQARDLSQGEISVDSEKTTLRTGHLVVQTLRTNVAHGSFDLVTKALDGREFKVVGSFTASIEP